jgi:exonuclease III
MNARWKWDAIRDKVVESLCDVVCFQETKKEAPDLQFLKNVCPPNLNNFVFLPSVGASGGIIVAWKGALFSRHMVFSNEFALTVEFHSHYDESKWLLTCVYGPCTAEGKINFINWLKGIQMSLEVNWIILGDFNLIRKPEDRNWPGGDLIEMFMFNEAISELGLVEIPLQGRKFTWSNMQPSPLLEKLDWVFTSNNWTLTFPSTTVKVLGMTPSDHCPCLVTFSTVIPRSKIFRFENFWLQHSGFSDVLTQSWAIPTQQIDPAKALTAKFKFLRKALKEWQAGWTGLKNLISNVKLLLQFLEVL